MPTTRPRYQPRKTRSGWYIEDTHTGAPVQTGLVYAGAVRLTDRLNQQLPAWEETPAEVRAADRAHFDHDG
jgi:hypothetical protein